MAPPLGRRECDLESPSSLAARLCLFAHSAYDYSLTTPLFTLEPVHQSLAPRATSQLSTSLPAPCGGPPSYLYSGSATPPEAETSAGPARSMSTDGVKPSRSALTEMPAVLGPGSHGTGSTAGTSSVRRPTSAGRWPRMACATDFSLVCPPAPPWSNVGAAEHAGRGLSRSRLA